MKKQVKHFVKEKIDYYINLRETYVWQKLHRFIFKDL